MKLKSVRVQHIRTHSDFSHHVADGVTLIAGDNGSGKTSLLEAIILGLQGTSFKATDSELLQHESHWWRIDITTDESIRTIKFDPSKTSGRKQFTVNDKTSYRLRQTDRYPIVLFEPDDLQLLHGSPTRRRQFIDQFIAQIDPTYVTVLRKYDRALKQRNALLKRNQTTRDDLFVWDIALGEYGARIIEERVRYCERLNAHLNETYNTIAQSNDVVTLHYSHTIIGDISHRIVNELHAHMERDILLGYTSVGPHRHDVIFLFNDKPALSVASRGEVRSIVLALKFLEESIITEETGAQPVILLDDVFGELDATRQTHLTTKFQDKQIIMTSATSAGGMDKALVIRL